MSRDVCDFVRDMIEACERIAAYTDGMDPSALRGDRKTLDAVIRNLEILGEAAKHIPDAVRVAAPGAHGRIDEPHQIRQKRRVFIRFSLAPASGLSGAAMKVNIGHAG